MVALPVSSCLGWRDGSDHTTADGHGGGQPPRPQGAGHRLHRRHRPRRGGGPGGRGLRRPAAWPRHGGGGGPCPGRGGGPWRRGAVPSGGSRRPGGHRRPGRRSRRAGHPGEQRRDPAFRPGRGHAARGLGHGHRRQPLGGLPPAAAGPAGDAATRLGPGGQHVLDLRPGRRHGPHRLRHQQDRADRADPRRGAGDRRERHHLQRALSRLHRAAAEAQFLAGKQPTGRFVQAEAVGAMAAFLCGEAGRDITGAVLPIDGGWSAC